MLRCSGSVLILILLYADLLCAQGVDLKELNRPDPCIDSPTQWTQKAQWTDQKVLCRNQTIFLDGYDVYWAFIYLMEHKFAGAPDYEFVEYREDSLFLLSIIGLASSNLWIKPIFMEQSPSIPTKTISPCSGKAGTSECIQTQKMWSILPPIMSARLNTKAGFSFTYGRVQIRAKLPRGNWIYPELYLNPVHEFYGPGYKSGQIRIAFVPGNQGMRHELYGGCIFGDSEEGRTYGMRRFRKDLDFTDDFHLYEVVWTPDGINVSVDGEIYGNIYPPPEGFVQDYKALNIDPETAERWKMGSKMAPFDKKMHLVIGVGVGGRNFPDSEDKPWKKNDPRSQYYFLQAKRNWHSTWGDYSKLLVDFVKVFAF